MENFWGIKICPYLTFKYQNKFNNAMFKWFWTIFSLGAPVIRNLKLLKERKHLNWTMTSYWNAPEYHLNTRIELSNNVRQSGRHSLLAPFCSIFSPPLSITAPLSTLSTPEARLEPGGGGVLPYKRLLMGMCRWMGLHFHYWMDYNGVAFSIELLEWGRTFSDFWG